MVQCFNLRILCLFVKIANTWLTPWPNFRHTFAFNSWNCSFPLGIGNKNTYVKGNKPELSQQISDGPQNSSKLFVRNQSIALKCGMSEGVVQHFITFSLLNLVKVKSISLPFTHPSVKQKYAFTNYM
jgi:hypothetical protein